MQQQSYFSDLQLADRYQVNRTTIWRWVARNYLPRPVQLSPGTTRWRRDEIESHEAQHRAVEARARSRAANVIADARGHCAASPAPNQEIGRPLSATHGSHQGRAVREAADRATGASDRDDAPACGISRPGDLRGR
jgi:prophage regulatory protein